MFRYDSHKKTMLGSALVSLELIFHLAVRDLRKSHGNAVLGLVMTVVQTIMMIVVMFFLFDFLGLRRFAVRGDFLLFVMSGVFMFMTHVSAIGAVSKAEGPTSPMMMHKPMNPLVAICGSALASLYKQTLSAFVILFLYHSLFKPISIHDPVGLLWLYLLAWSSGLGIGMVLRALRPWLPDLASILTSLFMRINMIASGKMVLVNNMAPTMRSWFDWNPLFHVIDQGRGHMFLNYTPHFTSTAYAVYFTLAFVVIGLMAEYFTAQHVSASWGKRR